MLLRILIAISLVVCGVGITKISNAQTPEFLSKVDEGVPFPPLTSSGLFMPYDSLNSDDPNCVDFLNIQTERFLSQPSVSIHSDIVRQKRENYRATQPLGKGRVMMIELRTGYGVEIDGQSLVNNKTFVKEGIVNGVKFRRTHTGVFFQLPTKPDGQDGEIFYVYSEQGSWRGNSGAIYLLTKSDVTWAELPWALITKNIFDPKKKLPFGRVRNSEKNENFNEILFNEYFTEIVKGFVGPNYWLHLAQDGQIYFQKMSWAKIPDNTWLYKINVGEKAPKLKPHCKIEMSLATPDMRYDILGYSREWGRELSYDYSTFENTGLNNFFLTLRQIVGAANDTGSMNSSGVHINKGNFARRQFLTAPWLEGFAYNSKQTVRLNLESWSYQGAWSRHKYLDLMKQYERALQDTKILIEKAYQNESQKMNPMLISQLAQQSLDHLVLTHFKFSKAHRYGVIHDKNPSAFQEIVTGGMPTDVFLSKLRLLPKTPIRNKGLNHLVFLQYDYVTASLFNDKLFNAWLSDEGKAEWISVRNYYGKTPLMVAAHLNMTNKVKDMLAVGVDVNVALDDCNFETCKKGHWVPNPRTALDYALENADFLLIITLLDADAKRAELSFKQYPDEKILSQNLKLDLAGRKFILSRLQKRRSPETAP